FFFAFSIYSSPLQREKERETSWAERAHPDPTRAQAEAACRRRRREARGRRCGRRTSSSSTRAPAARPPGRTPTAASSPPPRAPTLPRASSTSATRSSPARPTSPTSQRATPTAPPRAAAATSVPLGGGRCRNLLRTPPLLSRLASSATLWTLTVGFTSSCGLPEDRAHTAILSAESQLSVKR
ncbi:hypothetical protein U9M48_030622, partial [Paspalum notatum var. saurae]